VSVVETTIGDGAKLGLLVTWRKDVRCGAGQRQDVGSAVVGVRGVEDEKEVVAVGIGVERSGEDTRAPQKLTLPMGMIVMTQQGRGDDVGTSDGAVGSAAVLDIENTELVGHAFAPIKMAPFGGC